MRQSQIETASQDSPPAPAPKLSCRQIVDSDLPAVAGLLTRGFPERSRAYWDHALGVLAARDLPEGCPRFGFALITSGRVAGVVLLIYVASRKAGGVPRCYVSSWYVEDEVRAYASWLISRAFKQKQAVYINMSSAAHTRGTVIAQGYTCYAEGVFLALAALAPGAGKVEVRVPVEGDPAYALLMDHAAYGCISLICVAGGRRYPFVFLKRWIPKTILPCAHLIYRDGEGDFARFAGPLGRALLGRGLLAVMTDANGPVKGVPGHYFPGRQPKYYLGPEAPPLGDLAYSEAVLFGA